MGWHRFLVKQFCRLNDKMDTKRLQKKTPFEVDVLSDIPYLDTGSEYHLLDIYRPLQREGKLPVIIDIHGGGWVYGTKNINKHYCMGLATYGYVVVNASYRLITEESGGTFPNNLSDVVTALQWVYDNIENYGGDRENVCLTGDSAGAHLAAMATGIMVDSKFSETVGISTDLKINAVALTCGVYDIERFVKHKLPLFKYLLRRFFGDDYKNSPYRPYATIRNLQLENFPPVFLCSAFADFLKGQNKEFYKVLTDRNVPCELKFFEKRRVNTLGHVYNVLYPEWEESIETTDAMIAFFRQYEPGAKDSDAAH